MMKVAFEMSEKLQEPVLLRVVTRLAHSRAAVEVGEPAAENAFNPSTGRGWVLLPGIAKKQYAALLEKQPLMLEAAENSPYNRNEKSGTKLGVVACGIGYNYVKEAIANFKIDGINLLKISQYPLPENKILDLAAECEEILVVEDGQPVVETDVKTIVGDKATVIVLTKKR